jgi:Uma2 family endonuclease
LPRTAEEFQIMGMPAVSPEITTIDALRALPEDGLRHELLDGVHAVTPAPALPHQAMLREIYDRLAAALAGADGLQMFWSPADIVLGPRTLVQPDLFVVRHEPGRPPRRWEEVGVPVLAIEVLSPGTAARDRGAKRRIYQQAGVAEYWIVDLDARLVERWRPEDARPEVLSEALTWAIPGTGTPLTIDLPRLFATVR